MTTIFNDPAEFCDDQLDGFVDLYSDRLRKVACTPHVRSPVVTRVACGDVSQACVYVHLVRLAAIEVLSR